MVVSRLILASPTDEHSGRLSDEVELYQRTYNTLLRSTRCLGERGFALLTGRWRALQRVTISPRRIGELAQAALVLTRIENVQLRHSC